MDYRRIARRKFLIAYAVATVLGPLMSYMGAAIPVSSRTLYAISQRGNVFEKHSDKKRMTITDVAIADSKDAGQS